MGLLGWTGLSLPSSHAAKSLRSRPKGLRQRAGQNRMGDWGARRLQSQLRSSSSRLCSSGSCTHAEEHMRHARQRAVQLIPRRPTPTRCFSLAPGAVKSLLSRADRARPHSSEPMRPVAPCGVPTRSLPPLRSSAAHFLPAHRSMAGRSRWRGLSHRSLPGSPGRMSALNWSSASSASRSSMSIADNQRRHDEHVVPQPQCTKPFASRKLAVQGRSMDCECGSRRACPGSRARARCSRSGRCSPADHPGVGSVGRLPVIWTERKLAGIGGEQGRRNRTQGGDELDRARLLGCSYRARVPA